MNAKLFLISLVFLFSSFCFAGEKPKQDSFSFPEEKPKQDSFSFPEENYDNLSFPEEIYNLAKEGDLKGMKKVVEKYKNDKDKLLQLINYQDSDGWSSLHFSSHLRRLDMAEFLVKLGANIDIKNKLGYTPLHWTVAIRGGFTETQETLPTTTKMIHFFLKKRANPNTVTDWNDTVLHTAVKNRDFDAVKILLIARANPNVKDHSRSETSRYSGESVAYHQTPLHYAARDVFYHEGAMLKLLVRFGGDFDIKDNLNRTPYRIVAKQKAKEVLEFLDSVKSKRNQKQTSASKCVSVVIKK